MSPFFPFPQSPKDRPLPAHRIGRERGEAVRGQSFLGLEREEVEGVLGEARIEPQKAGDHQAFYDETRAVLEELLKGGLQDKDQ